MVDAWEVGDALEEEGALVAVVDEGVVMEGTLVEVAVVEAGDTWEGEVGDKWEEEE